MTRTSQPLRHREARSLIRQFESGQALVQFAFFAMAMMAMLTLMIDLGLLMVQRRFDQNAADAVALTIGRALQGAISLNTSNQVYFATSTTAIEAEIAKVFGSGKNEHTGLTSRVVGRAVGLEYSTNGGATWCYTSPTPAAPAGVPACSGIPVPAPNTPFRVRITVSSTTTGFFTGFANTLGASGGPCYRPATTPSGGTVTGTTTCAQAAVSVSGTVSPPQGLPIVPASVPDCWVQQQAAAGVMGGFFDLWGDNGVPCAGQPDTGAWKHLLDFSVYRTPSGSPDPSWHGAGYAADPSRPGTRDRADVAYWIARGYGGSVAANNWLYTGDPGNATGCFTNGFYGGGGACSDPAGRFFFEDANLVNREGKSTVVCRDVYPSDPVAASSANVGCREVAILGWADPQDEHGGSWDYITSGTPGRVRVAHFYVFRLYCRRNNPGSPCNQRMDVGNCNGASGICGRLVALPVSGQCPTCVTGPTVVANMVRLES